MTHTAAPPLSRTPLHDVHVALGAKMVPFAGFAMPVQYPSGITAEHLAVRTTAGLFDVSHMGEFDLKGPDALALIQKITVNDASTVQIGQAQYSAMTNERGTILDDLILYRRGESHWMLVVNASNRLKDWEWISGHGEGMDVEMEDQSDNTALLALQGPVAREILRGLVDVDLDAVGYYRFTEGHVDGVPAIISTTGYTGEDGFELYVPAAFAPDVWAALMKAGEPLGLVPAGLGARDSLRLEVGYALYGNDLDEEHTPLESALGWITKIDKGDFVGRDVLARQKEEGVAHRLVGLRLTARGFPRRGYRVLVDGEPVGVVTSGTMSPTLKTGIALGFVETAYAKAGTELEVEIRGKGVPAITQRPQFYTEGSIRR